ncbi:MAG: hypothetical protein JOY71_27765, partial [Acetobacteraceae bacterium]|nr:hypothetical protein [Acetobacteraceae bacterium]
MRINGGQLSPIFIMSFDRPDYLQQVLTSLRKQIGCNIERRMIVLFQDGAVNPISGRRHAQDRDINECVEVFRREFPDGRVVASDVNLGVALNFDRAERFGFEGLGAEAAIFLEDDLVLSEHYIATLDRLIATFMHDPRVGYVSAYGDHTKSLEAQRTNSNKLIIMTHNWGFALFRRQWIRMRRWVLEYLDAIRDADYRDRDPEKIRRLFASWGYGLPAISQDAAKTIACCVDGVIKVNTYVCNAAYVGRRGLHMNETIFAERGYQHTVLYPELITEFQRLDD